MLWNPETDCQDLRCHVLPALLLHLRSEYSRLNPILPYGGCNCQPVPPLRVSDARLIFFCPELWPIPGLELMRVQSTNWTLNQQAVTLDLTYREDQSHVTAEA